MGRLDRIEDLAISGTATHNNLRLIMRGKPWFVDPQLLNGVTRFAYTRGSQFSALFPSNQSPLAQNALTGSSEVALTNMPTWMTENTLVRIGSNEQIGELAIVTDVQDESTIVVSSPLISDYIVDETQTGNIPVATLMGTPCTIYEVPTVNLYARYAQNSLRVEIIDPLEPISQRTVGHSDISSRIGCEIEGLGIQAGVTVTGIEIDLTVSDLTSTEIYEIKKTSSAIVVTVTHGHTFKKDSPVFITNTSVDSVNGSWVVTDVFSPTSFSINAPLTLLDRIAGQKSVGGTILETIKNSPYLLKSGDNLITVLGSITGRPNTVTLTQSFPDYLLGSSVDISGFGLPTGAMVLGVKYFAVISAETSAASLDPASLLTLADNRYLVLESWWPLVQSDVLLMSRTPNVLTSLIEYPVAGVVPAGTRGSPASFFATYSKNSFRLAIATADISTVNYRIGHIISGLGIPQNTIITGIETTEDQSFVIISTATTKASLTPSSEISFEASFGEPPVVYRFVVSLATKTGLLPFVPALGDKLFLRAQPLYYTRDFGVGDVSIPETQGPFLFDAYFGSMISEYKIDTKLGIKLWDGFGTQIGEGWTEIKPNHIILERPILSESLLFWQRIEGNFQYQKDRFFQAELSERGRFTMSSDLLVPKWPADKKRSWVIPVKSPVAVKMIIQFEPQPPMVVEIPANTLTYVRPSILEDDVPIDRIMLSFSGDAETRVEIQDWRYDGEIPRSFSYYILGTGECYGNGRWLAGGFSIKSIFYALSSLKARYSDTVSRYNAGYLYR